MLDDWKDDRWDPGSATGRFRGGGSEGSSFRMLMIFERFAGVALGGSTMGWIGVEFGRGGSFGIVNRFGKRISAGE